MGCIRPRSLRAASVLAADMDVQLSPDFVEIAAELRFAAGGEWGWSLPVAGRKLDRVVGLDGARPLAHHDDAIGHADRFRDVMRDQNDSLRLAPQNPPHLLRKRETGLKIECRERLIQQQDLWLDTERTRQRGALAHTAGELLRV